ncbi:MAG TPA: hypothetical protein VLG74_01150 [Blastocatellia bacterium]|nr:hypothetical protein [Blastocatellia bacterium]
MSDQERETVRRVLEALLAKLDGESRGVGDRAAPVIVVLDGLNSTAQGNERCRPRFEEPGASATAQGFAPGQDNRQASHPGLERFPLAEPQSQSSVPKACFMEPERTCISSGACEMRGY